MGLLLTFLLIGVFYLQNVSAATWYFLRWNTPNTSSQFQRFSMKMTVPKLQKKGTYYLWPGLQDTANTGVYQSVLDGRSGTWWIGSGWCCSNPNLPWGDGFNVAVTNTVDITMTHTPAPNNWTSTVAFGSHTATNSFALGNKDFNQAILAIELTGVSWDFGELVWENVVMVMNTTSTSWCTKSPENYNSATKYTSTGGKATVSGNEVTCTIDRIVMQGPNASKAAEAEVEEGGYFIEGDVD